MPRFVRNCWVETEFFENGSPRGGPSFGPKTRDGQLIMRLYVKSKEGGSVRAGLLVVGPTPGDPKKIVAVFHPSGKPPRDIYRE